MQSILITLLVVFGIVGVSGQSPDLSNEVRVPMESSISTFSNDAWVQERGVHDDDYVLATFVMKLDKEKLRSFETMVLERSDPKSPTYGQYMSNSEIQSMISPSMDDVKTLLAYLTANGIANDDKGNTVTVSKLRTTVRVRMSGTIAEKLLQTQFVQYRSVTERSATVYRVARGYSLPRSIAAIVAYVDDVLRFPAVSAPHYTYGHADSGLNDEQASLLPVMDSNSDASKDPYLSCSNRCYGFSTPAVLQRQYGLDSAPVSQVADASLGSGLGMAAFNHKGYNPKDVDAFVDMCGVADARNGEVNTAGRHKHRASCDMGACVETTMAVQYAKAITSPMPLSLFYGDEYSLMHWLTWMLDAKGATPSSGDGEADNGEAVPLVQVASQLVADNNQLSGEYKDYINTHFMLAAAKGYSVLYMAGDNGVWGRGGLIGRDFNPDFPTSAPWVTTVGGTNIKSPQEKGSMPTGPRTESVWECSGGGFSDHFATPEWQRATVRSYLNKGTADASLPSSKLYNATGRAFPDITAVAGETNPFCVVFDNAASTIGISSTSASSTVMASIFAQANNKRLLNGRPPLGFLNPLLYSDSFPRSCYQDVRDNSLNNCHLGTAGFAAVEGWDAASGWGSLNAKCMMNYLSRS